jgi:DNA polymerase type B, organellar and viral
MTDRFCLISTAEYQRQKRLRRERNSRYLGTHPDFRVNHMGPNESERKFEKRQLKIRERPFIFWDGEGPQDTGYSLFGNSAGYEVCYPGLSTKDCLELITQTGREHPQAIHISFGFNYDVSMILKDLSHRSLRALAKLNATSWNYWRIEHIPHKWFKVSFVVNNEPRVTVKIYDIRTFFQGGYVGCLEKFNVGTPEQLAILTSGKANRPDFMWADIEEIKEYWKLELELGPKLGDALRASLDAAGYLPYSWHGPGALARMALRRHGVYKAMAKTPARVQHAARYAYAGGRFDPYIIGEVNGPIYEADINSAYPFYATSLPNLARGKWRNGRKFETGKFGLYHIRYHRPDPVKEPSYVYPLFRRIDNHLVRYPHRVEGWYWAPEAELVKDDPNAEFVESLVFDEDDPSDRPFAFLAEYFARRKRMDRDGDIGGYGYKILINAIYGQLAQRAGWDKKKRTPPRSHQLEWAGYITSACRAAVCKAARECGDKLISINTDSVMALCPLDDIVDTGNELGQWKTSQYSGGLFWQSGIYTLQEDMGYPPELDYGWNKARTRGIPRGQYTTDQLRDCIRNRKPLRLTRKMFITYALANMGSWDKLNTWNAEPSDYEFGGNEGKRTHMFITRPGYPRNPDGSPKCFALCRGLPKFMHRTMNNIIGMGGEDMWSKPHWLPWLDEPSQIKSQIDAYMVDLNELDPEEEWNYADVPV